jgi:hypothetical protein
MKICSKCKIEKEVTEYHKKCNGVQSRCKACISVEMKIYQLKNKEEISIRRKKSYEVNRDTLLKEKREYYNNNKEKLKEKQSKYYTDNKSMINKRNNTYVKNRRKIDPLFRLTKNYSGRVKSALSGHGWTKKGSSKDLLGCTQEEWVEYLNNNPYDFSVDDIRLDVDHIIPCSTAKTPEELEKLNHYTNLQLLPSEYNRHIKLDNPWDKDHFENWLSENWSWD